MKNLMYLLFAAVLFVCSCEEKECPEGMEDCQLNSGESICVPEGKC